MRRFKQIAIGGLLTLLLLVFVAWKILIPRDSRSPRYTEILNSFLAAQPVAINISPDGKYLLTKTETNGGFKVSALDSNTKKEVVSTFSKNSQLELTWRPDSKAIIFQEIDGMERPLYFLDFKAGSKVKVKAPVSHTALPSLRWNPSGTQVAYFEGDWRTGRLLVIDVFGNAQPIVIADSVSDNCDFIWAPDGKRLAYVTESDPGILTIVSFPGLIRTRFSVVEGEVKKLAWSPDETSILAAARGTADEYFKLIALDVQSGKVAVKFQPAGDVNQPLWMPDGQSFICQVNFNGITRAFLTTRDSNQTKVLGPTNGVLTISHVDPDGKTAYAHFSSLTAPPVLGSISVPGGDWTNLFSCPTAELCRCPEPEFISIKSGDGTDVPAYVWRAAAQPAGKPSALVVVHGGLHTQTFPTWEAYIHAMTSLGCNVIAVNHRGSSGIGQKYEKLKGDPILDIIAARDYAATTLNVEPGRIIMTGISTGSRLISIAAARGAEIGGLVLVSWPGQRAAVEGHFARVVPVLEFHGDLDTVLSPKEAKKSMENFFGGGDARLKVRYWTFPDEGHFFYRSDSRAVVYDELSKLILPVQ